MKKTVSVLLLFLGLVSFGATAFAQGTILPGAGELDCKEVMKEVGKLVDPAASPEIATLGLNKVLGCAVKTGDVQLWMIPHFVIYAIEGLLAVAGLIAVLFIIIGGYQYAIGGLTEERDKGKKSITYAIGGLVVALLAWAIVNLVQLALTG